MTGRGHARIELEPGVALSCTVESRNGKRLELRTRAPNFLGERIPELEKRIRGSIRRGTVTFTIELEGIANETEIDVDAIRGLHEQLRDLRDELGTPDLKTLLALPGATRTTKPTLSEAAVEGLRNATELALSRYREHTIAEGMATAAALERQFLVIENAAKEARDIEAQAHAIRTSELRERLVASPVAETLAEEVAALLKADIGEELERLAAHLELARSTLSEDVAGRRLDFLGAEMLREANTLGAKVSSARASHLAIEIKLACERIREQSMNLA